jgi:hypothetical protein
MVQRLLLGPQRPITNLAKVVANAALPEGPIAVISAGWQEAEGDIDDVYELVQKPLVDLNLYHRAEAIFAADEKLHSSYRQRQDRLQELQRLYRLRLRQLMLAARQILRADAASDLIAAEQRHAIAQLRALDRHQLKRIQSIYAEFADDINPEKSELLATNIAEIRAQIDSCSTVIITGGNVVVLLNRLQLFNMRELLRNRHIIAWSAGAMVLSDLIVLFHDKTPLGQRDAEVLGQGMGLLPGQIFLPDAKRRLRERDRVRMGLFHGRFSPARCITLDSGSVLQLEDDRIIAAEGAGRLSRTGAVNRLQAR